MLPRTDSSPSTDSPSPPFSPPFIPSLSPTFTASPRSPPDDFGFNSDYVASPLPPPAWLHCEAVSPPSSNSSDCGDAVCDFLWEFKLKGHERDGASGEFETPSFAPVAPPPIRLAKLPRGMKAKKRQRWHLRNRHFFERKKNVFSF